MFGVLVRTMSKYNKFITEELQNQKCLGCKFCLWDYDRQEYVCIIRGCYENSKYVEYRMMEDYGL